MLTLFLDWGVPILWGALIGYFTNALAIRMLFRPLTRKYVLGIPVPLTPGIIPRQRAELAQSIARMVARELLSAEAVRARLQTASFRRALESQVRSVREALLRRPLAELTARARRAVEAPAEADGDGSRGDIAWPDLLRHLVRRLAERLTGAPAFLNGVRSLVRRLVDDFGARRLSDLVSAEQFTAFVSGTLAPALAGKEVRAQAARLIQEWLRRQRADNAPLQRFLTPETTELLLDLFRRNLPALLNVLFTWLRGPRVRSQLEISGRAILRDVLDKLNLAQKVFIAAGGYEGNLRKQMPEIVSNVIDQAEEATAGDAVREQICGGARRALQQLSSRSLGDLAADSADRLDALVDHLVARVFDAIAGRGAAEAAAAPVVAACGRWYEQHRDATAAELAGRYLGLQAAAVADPLADHLLGWLARPETAAQVAELVPALTGGAAGTPANAGSATLEEVLALPPGVPAQLDGALTRQAIRFLGERLPAVMETIDVQALVVAKINALDAGDVERLLLAVMERHLKWIKLFGALLGAAIGVLLIVLRAVSPAA